MGTVPKSIIIFVLLCSFGTLDVDSVKASVFVTTNAAQPCGELLTYHSVGEDNFAWSCRWIGNSGTDHTEICQSFIVDSSNDWVVDKITVKVREFGTSVENQDFRLDIWSVSDASDYTGNNLIDSQSGAFPASGLVSGYWTFDLDDVTLSAGQYFAFVLGFESGPDSQRFVNLVNEYSAYDTYIGGRMFIRSGTPPDWSTTGHVSDKDFDFYIQGVPEPGIILLVGLGGVMLRKRKK
jgi:hypothetical protein